MDFISNFAKLDKGKLSKKVNIRRLRGGPNVNFLKKIHFKLTDVDFF